MFVSVDGFRSSVPGHGHVGLSSRTAEGQDAVRRVAQVKHWYLYWQGGRTTTQRQSFIYHLSTGTVHLQLPLLSTYLYPRNAIRERMLEGRSAGGGQITRQLLTSSLAPTLLRFSFPNTRGTAPEPHEATV